MNKEKRLKYNAFCEKAELPVFVRDWYMDDACRDGIWDVIFEEEKGEVIAVWPYFLKRKYGFVYMAMPPFVRYLGPFLLPEYNSLKDQHRIFASLESRLPKVHSFNQSFDPSVTNWLPFYWKGYKQNTRYTYRLNIENLETVFQNFEKDIRKKIRKASKQLHITEEGTIDQFYEVHKMTFDRQNIPIRYSKDFFSQHAEALTNNTECKWFFAKDEQEQIHAVSCLVKDGEMAYYHLSGGNPDLRNSGAGILLMWHIIQYAKAKWDVNVFDFEGSMIKGVEQIWHRAGACQVPYFNIQKTNSKLFRILEMIKGR